MLAAAALVFSLVTQAPATTLPAEYIAACDRLRGKLFEDTKGMTLVVSPGLGETTIGFWRAGESTVINAQGQRVAARDISLPNEDVLKRQASSARGILMPYLLMRSGREDLIRPGFTFNPAELSLRLRSEIFASASLSYFFDDLGGALSSLARLRRHLNLLPLSPQFQRAGAIVSPELVESHYEEIARRKRLNKLQRSKLPRPVRTREEVILYLEGIDTFEFDPFAPLPREQDTDLIVHAVLHDTRIGRDLKNPAWHEAEKLLARMDPFALAGNGNEKQRRAFWQGVYPARQNELPEDRWLRIFLHHGLSPHLQKQMVLKLHGLGEWKEPSNSMFKNLAKDVSAKHGERISAILYNNLGLVNYWQAEDVRAIQLIDPKFGNDVAAEYLLREPPMAWDFQAGAMIARLVADRHPASLPLLTKLNEQSLGLSFGRSQPFAENLTDPAISELAGQYFTERGLEWTELPRLVHSRVIAVPAFRQRLIKELDDQTPKQLRFDFPVGQPPQLSNTRHKEDVTEWNLIVSDVIAPFPGAPQYSMRAGANAWERHVRQLKAWLADESKDWYTLGLSQESKEAISVAFITEERPATRFRSGR